MDWWLVDKTIIRGGKCYQSQNHLPQRRVWQMSKMATNDPPYLKPCQKIRSLQTIVRNELRNPYRWLPVIAAAKKSSIQSPKVQERVEISGWGLWEWGNQEVCYQQVQNRKTKRPLEAKMGRPSPFRPYMESFSISICGWQYYTW